MAYDPMYETKLAFVENHASIYRDNGFTLEECIDTVAKQFKLGKKVVRPIITKLYLEEESRKPQ